MKAVIILALILLAGCYESGPAEGDVRTVPVTNNPHAMPGSINTGPLPSIF